MSALPHDVALPTAIRGHYRGAESAANYGSVRAEYHSLCESCGICELNWLSRLTLTGADRIRWMNGMVTNNVRDLAVNRGAYNFVLNVQGRIQGDLYVFNRAEKLLLTADQSQSQTLQKLLDSFIIMDDVEISSAPRNLRAIGVRGPKAQQVLASLGLNVTNLAPLEVRDLNWRAEGKDSELMLIPGEFANDYEVWISAENQPAFWRSLLAAGATPVGYEALELARIARGIPAYSQDIRERDLPQETGQNRALNFIKGCYVGQEIVERIHSRGNVHRQFAGFEFPSSSPPVGSKLLVEEKEVGEITSSATLPTASPSTDRHVALGYIRREFAQAGKQISAGGLTGSVTPLPFEKL